MKASAIWMVFIAAFVLVSTAGSAPVRDENSQKFPNVGGFDLPDLDDDLEDIVRDVTDIDYIVRNLPGFGLSMDNEDPVTTSFDDAVTEVPYLDAYPHAEDVGMRFFTPLRDIPWSASSGRYLMPGRYEHDLETFCLHAGTYGPGQGEGYLYAPLRGEWAGIVQSILFNSQFHPEFTQTEIQYLVWAVLARTDLNDMSDYQQEIARVLLSDDQLAEITMSAFGVIPRDMMGDVFDYIDVPYDVERVMRSNADIRRLATEEFASYDELEAVAILAGNPPDGADRDIPQERWSYHPEGYFIRYDPSGYSRTHINMVVPDSFDIEVTDDGNLINLLDEHGSSLSYDGSTLTYSYRDPMDAYDYIEEVWTDFDPDVSVRESWIDDHREEVERLCGEDYVDTVLEIGKLGRALELELGPGHGEAAAACDFVMEAWMNAVVRVNMVRPTDEDGEGSKDLPEFDWRDRWSPYDPTDDVANPANRGRQRLGGRDPRPSEDPDWSAGDDPRIKPYKPDSQPEGSRAMDGVNKFSDVTDKLSWIENGPAGHLTSSWGFAIPNKIFSEGLKWVVNMWEFCAGEISSDPPRFDYDEIAEPEAFTFVFLESPQDGPADQVNALNDLMVSFLDVAVLLRAAMISVERQSGAVIDGDDNWAWEQAKAAIYYMRQSGYAMHVAADKLDAWIALLRSQGVTDVYVTAEDFSDAQDELESSGYSSEEMDMARTLGMPEAIIDEFMERELSASPQVSAGSLFPICEELSLALREFGNYLINMPDAYPDGYDSAGMWVSISP